MNLFIRRTTLAALWLLAANAVLPAQAHPSPDSDQEISMHHAQAMLRSINPTGAVIPGISQAVVVEHGRTMYLSGHVPMTADGQVLSSDLEQQLDQVFRNLNATLAVAGASSSNLARITIYVRDFQANQLPAIRRARDRFIDQEHPPASALIGVAELFHPDVRVEVEAVAILPPGA